MHAYSIITGIMIIVSYINFIILSPLSNYNIMFVKLSKTSFNSYEPKYSCILVIRVNVGEHKLM